MLLPVQDPDDPRLLAYVGLRDHQLRMRREKSGGDMAALFVAEGDRVVDRALRAGYQIQSALVDGRRTTPLPDLIPDDIPVYAVAPPVLQKISFQVKPGEMGNFAVFIMSTSNNRVLMKGTTLLYRA